MQSDDVLWHATSVLLGGPLLWGGLGFLAGAATGWTWLLPVGIVIGFVGAMYVAFVRYFAENPVGPPTAPDTPNLRRRRRRAGP